jgi:type II secretory pathway component GspD/PulD (secretin)
MRWSALRYYASVTVLCLAFFGAETVWAAGFDQDPPSELAAALAKKAKRAEKAGNTAQAYAYYSQASALQPRNRSYRSKMQALQLRGGAQGIPGGSSASVSPSDAGLDDASGAVTSRTPDLFDSITARELAGERRLASPPALAASPGLFDFDLTDTARVLFEKVAARLNIRTVFDGDYPPAGTPVRFRLTQVNYREALDAVQAATGSFVVPLSAHVIMVARDTPAKRNDLEQYVALTLNVPQVVTPQELAEIVQVVRQATNVEKIGFDNANNQIVIRDRISRAAPAQALLAQLFDYHPEVMIDLELLQVSDNDVINYGLTVTSSFPLAYLGGIQNSLPSIPSGVANLLTFGAGRTLIGIGAAEVQSMFNESSSTGRSLYSARLRAGSGQAGTFHVGEKYPIITSGFIGASSTNTSGSTSPAFAAPPAITWENLGLDLKATPRIHGDDEVTMAVEATYEVLNGQSDDGIPEIETDKIVTNIRLRNDEWAVIAGMMDNSHSKSSSGIRGLGNLPLIGNLFRSTSINKSSGSLLIGIRPHIMYMGPDEYVARPLRVGTDARPYTPL